jgi:type VI secretion system protein ImpH
MAEKSPLENLAAQPERFRFDAAFRLLRLASGKSHDDDRVRFNGSLALAQPAAEVARAQAATASDAARMVTPLIGLAGASGVMPRWYSEIVAQAVRARSPALAHFFDLLAQRIITAFARAGAKYRLHRAAEEADIAGEVEPIGASVLALTGYGTADLANRVAAGADALRQYSGFFSSRPRSAERLQAMISDYLGRPAELIEFAGSWLLVPPDQQTRMPRGRIPGAFNQLGADAAIGTRAWDQQARFVVRVGPLRRGEFEALLPDQPKLCELVSLIRAYAGWEADFAINLVLEVAEIPPLRMAGSSVPGAPRLGWTSWLPSTTGTLRGRTTADEAMFSAGLVESRAV